MIDSNDVEINRYVHSYIEYLLNRLKQIIDENGRKDIEQLLIDNGFENYSKIQKNRIINDEKPVVDFNIYSLLEDYRKLYEIYDIENTEESIENTFKYEEIGENKYRVVFEPTHISYHESFALNKETYTFELEIKDGIKIEEVLQNEAALLNALRNSDSHGDNEVILKSDYNQMLEFTCNKRNKKSCNK